MCEITCENFYSELPTIEAALIESSFISIDMEFSKIDETIYKPFRYVKFWFLKKIYFCSCIVKIIVLLLFYLNE